MPRPAAATLFLVVWLWAIIALALSLALLSLLGDNRRAAHVSAALSAQDNHPPLPATVIVPVKGPDEGLGENLAALAALDYPDYELIVAARKPEDVPPGVVPSGARLVFAGEGDAETGEKIRNLLSGVAAARPSSAVFAFADSDGRVGRSWLRALVAGLSRPGAGAATGYRWFAPDPPDFWSLLRAVWNAAILECFGPNGARFAWGGAMAVQRDLFERMSVPAFWKGAVSDDYGLTAAVRRAGLRIVYVPGALVACPDHTSAGEFLRWMRRQLVIVRVHDPALWWLAFAATLVHCAAEAACVATGLLGNPAGWPALGAIVALGMLKGARRASLAQAALPEYGAWFQRHGWVYGWWVPLGTWAWLYTFLVSAWSNRIEWRGRRYVLRAHGAKKL